MVPFGKVFARKPEDWFSGSLLSSFAVSRFGKKRKTPEKPWNILSGPSWATLPDHSSAQNYQLRKVMQGHVKIGTYLPKCRNAGKPFQYWLFSKNLHESTEVKLLSPPNYFAV